MLQIKIILKKNFKILFFIIIGIIYFFVLSTILNKKIVTGDEPHYLVYTKSIVQDFDTNVVNNYVNSTLNEFNLPENLQKHIFYIDDKPFPLHQIGLPIILSIPYSVSGYMGIRFFHILFSLIGIYFLYLIVKKHKNKYLIFFTIGFTSLIYPANIYLSSELYPETYAYTLILISYFLINNSSYKFYKFYLILINIILLFLNTKFIFLIAGFFLFYIVKNKQKFILNKNYFIVIIPLLIYLTVTFLLYDGNLAKALSNFSGGSEIRTIDPLLIPKNLYLILLDGKQGIVWVMPLIITILDYSLSTKIFHYKNRLKLIIFLPYLLLILSYFQVLGGVSPNGRYLFPLYGLFQIFLINYWDKNINNLSKVLIFISIFVNSILLFSPNILFVHPNLPIIISSFFDILSKNIYFIKDDFYAITTKNSDIIKSMLLISFIPLIIITNKILTYVNKFYD